MKYVLLHLSLLLAFGAFAGDWQSVAEISSFESIVTKSEYGSLDNTHLDELDFAVLTSIAELGQAQPSSLLDTTLTSVIFSRIRGFLSIRAPPVFLT